MRRALAPFAHVILLVPDADVALSLDILCARDPVVAKYRDLNEHFLRHPSNWTLARFVCYTKNLSPAEACDAIVRWIRLGR